MENAQPEPSMEEILASIRKIISEDEDDHSAVRAKPHAETKPAAPEPLRPKPESHAVRRAPETEEPMTLVSPKQEEVRPAPHPEPESIETMRQNVAAAMEEHGEDEFLDQTTAEVASEAFRTLSQSVRISEGPGRTLEDIVTEMLRPMIKEWLNANLPAIVEEKVEEEVQRVARRRR